VHRLALVGTWAGGDADRDHEDYRCHLNILALCRAVKVCERASPGMESAATTAVEAWMKSLRVNDMRTPMHLADGLLYPFRDHWQFTQPHAGKRAVSSLLFSLRVPNFHISGFAHYGSREAR
jgi:hypothetical protein